MVPKILYFVNTSLIEFGIARYLQEKFSHESYMLLEMPDIAKEFFLNQKIIKFKKTWDFQTEVKNINKTYDNKFLENFESKYKIKLWRIILADRLFHSPKFYNFTNEEILSLIEKECRLFENIIIQNKIDYLCLNSFSGHHPLLLCRIAEKNNVKILMITPTRMGYKTAIHSNYDIFDKFDDIKLNFIKKEVKNPRQFFEKYNLSTQVKKFNEDYFTDKISKQEEIITGLNFLLFQCNNSYRSYFPNFGKTRKNIIKSRFKSYLEKKKSRKFLIDHILTKLSDEKFFYFPLQMVPERAFELEAEFCPSQFEIIKLIIKSMPFGYKLYLKEHPVMYASGLRKKSFYEDLQKLPNVFLLDPSMNQEEIIKKSSLVITVNGTSSLEAVFLGKPSITFAKTGYSWLDSVYFVEKFQDLPRIFDEALNCKIDDKDLKKFINDFEENTFDFDIYGFINISNKIFFRGGTIGNVKIPESKMVSYLKKFELDYKELAQQHLNKIIQYEKLVNN